MSSSKWKELDLAAKQRGLEGLGEQAKVLAMESHAASTVKGYGGAFKRWKCWAEANQFESLPAKPVAVSLYLVELMNQAQSPSPVNLALSALKWAHSKACLPLPVDDMVEQISQAAKRRLARPPARKEPLRPQEISEMVNNLIKKGGCLNLRSAVMIAVGFAGFLRWNDMENLLVRNIAIHSEFMEIKLEKRKNDQMRRGSVVLVSRQEGECCPVTLCSQLIDQAGLQPDNHLLSNLVQAKDGWKPKKGVLQYSRARELLLEAVGAIGLEAKRYGLHSLRSGGTTAAAAKKVPERLLRRHGGWRSEAIHCYVEESLENMLRPSTAAAWC